MPIRRSYADHGDACAAARAMDVVGDRWSLPIIRELLLGPKTYSGLQQSLHGIAPDVLVTRLRHLEKEGVLIHAGAARGATYQLTEWGHAFHPVLDALGSWVQASPASTPEGDLTPDAAALAMLTMAPRPTVTVPEFDLTLIDPRSPTAAEGTYRLHWGPDRLQLTRHQHPGIDQVRCEATTWTRLLLDPPADKSTPLPFLATTGQGETRARAIFADYRRTPRDD